MWSKNTDKKKREKLFVCELSLLLLLLRRAANFLHSEAESLSDSLLGDIFAITLFREGRSLGLQLKESEQGFVYVQVSFFPSLLNSFIRNF